jgi:hypothetical protein
VGRLERSGVLEGEVVARGTVVPSPGVELDSLAVVTGVVAVAGLAVTGCEPRGLASTNHAATATRTTTTA